MGNNQNNINGWKIKNNYTRSIRKDAKRKFHHLKKRKLKTFSVQKQVLSVLPNKMSSKNFEHCTTKLARAFFAFQREGVKFTVEHGGRALIADKMGFGISHLRVGIYYKPILGKSIQAIAVAAHYREDWPVLILCPSAVHFKWAEEIMNCWRRC
jgi:SWI/SNF-related matrix-associated actin-dependent regulator 1 of chromatin subfamily A